MNWSGGALKATIGAGTLCFVAVIGDKIVEMIGLYPMIGVVLVPLMLLVFFKPGEVADKWVKIAHGLAVLLYLLMFIWTVQTMYQRGFEPTDGLLGFFMLLGLLPLFVILRNFSNGHYDGAYERAQPHEGFDFDDFDAGD